jgi:hypothetical protein
MGAKFMISLAGISPMSQQNDGNTDFGLTVSWRDLPASRGVLVQLAVE